MAANAALAAPDVAHHAALDARMVRAASGIKLLTLASWPAGIEVQFLADYARGTASAAADQLPDARISPRRARELDAIAAEADAQHPLGDYLIEPRELVARREPARGARHPRGHRAFDPPVRQARRTAARRRPDHARGRAALHLARRRTRPRADGAGRARDHLRRPRCSCSCRRDLDDFFDAPRDRVELDPDLIAKAAAGPTRIRLRSGAGVHRVRPPPVARARGLRAFADRAQRPRAAGAAEPGAGVAAHHRDAGRAGDVRRTDHRRASTSAA